MGLLLTELDAEWRWLPRVTYGVLFARLYLKLLRYQMLLRSPHLAQVLQQIGEPVPR